MDCLVRAQAALVRFLKEDPQAVPSPDLPALHEEQVLLDQLQEYRKQLAHAENSSALRAVWKRLLGEEENLLNTIESLERYSATLRNSSRLNKFYNRKRAVAREMLRVVEDTLGLPRDPLVPRISKNRGSGAQNSPGDAGA